MYDFEYVKKTYFFNRDYVALYLNNFFNYFAIALLETFSAVLLYKIGVPIYLILVFFALQFGFTGLFSPLSPMLISRFGLVYTILIANLFKLFGLFFLLGLEEFSSIYVILIFIFFSLDEAISNPLDNAFNAIYIKDEHKGRFNSLNTVLRALASILAVLFAGYFIFHKENFYLLLIVISFLVCAIICLKFFLNEKKLSYKYNFIDSYKFLFNKNFKPNLLPFGIETFLIIELFFIPLFIYIVVGDFRIVSYIIAVAIMFEIIITFLFGKQIDKFIKKAFLESTILKSLTPIFFMIFHFNLSWLYFNQTYAKISRNLFTNSFETLIQKKAKEDNPLLFSTAKEMILCFTEFFVLLLFALFAYFIDDKIFILIFLSSFIGVWIIYFFWRD